MSEEGKLNWNRLRSYKCPICRSDLRRPFGLSMHFCSNKDCNFKIANERFEEVIRDMYENVGRDEEAEERLAELRRNHSFGD